jgi:hypothetical protein
MEGRSADVAAHQMWPLDMQTKFSLVLGQDSIQARQACGRSQVVVVGVVGG